MVATLKAGGMTGVILTCKHHDGYCLWPTKTTEHSVIDSVTAALYDKHLLLVLDNVEHLLPAAPSVASLLAACPSIKVLATSRAALLRAATRWSAVSKSMATIRPGCFTPGARPLVVLGHPRPSQRGPAADGGRA